MGITAVALIGGAIVGAAASGGFKGSTPAAAPPPKPMPTPTADTAAVEAARRRSLAMQVGRRGRSSTIMTGEDDRLGG
jgi:hypothetical protein